MKLSASNSLSQDARASRRAFTLIELILVMALLVIVIGVSAPTLSGFFHGRTLDSESRRFLSLTRYAQSRAVNAGVPVMVWIDDKAGTYGLQVDSTYADSDPKNAEYTLDKDVSVEVGDAPKKSLLSSTRSTGRGQSTSSMASRAKAVSKVPTIRFQPDGFIDATSPQFVLFFQGERDTVVIAQSRNRIGYEIKTNELENLGR